MTKLKQIIAITLVMCSVLVGCGKTTNADKAVSDISSTALSTSDSQASLVGRWEGTGYFDSLAYEDEEFTYILDFFEDGKMTISSSNMYFYGVEVEDVSVNNDVVEFTIPFNNPLLGEDWIPFAEREMMKIYFSLQISKDQLKGNSKQDDREFGITFKKISDQPRSFSDTDVLTVEQMQEDANVLFSVLESNHVNIYYVQSEEKYKQKKEEFLKKLPTLDKRGFFYEIKRLIATIGDGHTGIQPSTSMNKTQAFLPIEIDYFSGKWYIVQVNKQYESLLGKEITAINDIPFDDVFTRVLEMRGYENMASARNQFKYDISNVDMLDYIGVMKDGKATITVNGDKTVMISAVKQSEVNEEDFVKLGPSPKTAYNPDMNYLCMPIDGDILYIQYNACVEQEDYRIPQFALDIAKELNAKQYKKIVVDLRNNGGGNSGLLFQFIEPVMWAHKNGSQVYCLIGNKTFSAAFDNAIYFKQEGIPLVGQPTGGNMQQFTQISLFDLPNSRFKGQYSTRYMNYDENSPYDSLYPDKQIDHTIEAYINGIDEEIEYIKKQ